MPLARTGRRDALSKADFHAQLRDWLMNSDDSIVGDPEVQGRAPWVYVRDDERLFRLHADARREAVADYLGLVESHGDAIEWTIVPNERGNPNAVAYGPDRQRIRPFYLYSVA